MPGKPAARLGDTAMDCADPTDTPTGTVVAQGTVFINKLPAAKQGDQIVGVDIHIVMVPSPTGPVPTPLPHPFAGMINGECESTVKIMGMPAAVVGSTAQNMPPHVPQGGPFQKPPANKAKILVGSPNVFIGTGGGGGGGGGSSSGSSANASVPGQSIETSDVSPSQREGHFLHVAFEDGGSTPLLAVGYALTDAEDRPSEGMLSGPVHRLQGTAGQGSVLLKDIIRLGWSVSGALALGETVTLQLETTGIVDGAEVVFEIFERSREHVDRFITRMADQRVVGNKAEVSWTYELNQAMSPSGAGDAYSAPDYYFTAEVGGIQKRSGILAGVADLEVEVCFEDDTAVVDEPFVLFLSTGEIREGRTDGAGWIRASGVPPRSVKVWFPQLEGALRAPLELVFDPESGGWASKKVEPVISDLAWATDGIRPGEAAEISATIANFSDPDLSFESGETYQVCVYRYAENGAHEKVSVIEHDIEGESLSATFEYPAQLAATSRSEPDAPNLRYFFTVVVREIEAGLDMASGFLQHLQDAVGAETAPGTSETPPVAAGQAEVETVVEPGCRPGYDGYELPASAPAVLDFLRTNTVLADLDEPGFRQRIVDSVRCMDDLGLNRSKGSERADAYLDMVTWDQPYRASWTNDNTRNSSSCGMFVRNTWWLAGARGSELMDKAYDGGVISELLAYEAAASKRWGSGFNANTFFPKAGDVLYLYDPKTNSQHIFTISHIDKAIVDESGVATVYNDDGTLASEITFTSVDGGQADGYGPDGNGRNKTWGCQAIMQRERPMRLKDGRFMSIGERWPMPNGTNGRPINTWIDLGLAQHRFTAGCIQPVRNKGGVPPTGEEESP